MKKMFLMAIVACGVASVGFGDTNVELCNKCRNDKSATCTVQRNCMQKHGYERNKCISECYAQACEDCAAEYGCPQMGCDFSGQVVYTVDD